MRVTRATVNRLWEPENYEKAFPSAFIVDTSFAYHIIILGGSPDNLVTSFHLVSCFQGVNGEISAPFKIPVSVT